MSIGGPTPDPDGEEDADVGPFTRWVRGSIRDPERTYRAMLWTALIFFLVFTLFPFYWLLIVALTPRENVAAITLTPEGFYPQSFIEVFTTLPFHRYVFNSIVVAGLSTIIILLVGSLAGYAFGRLQFRGKRTLFFLILIISYFPPAAFLLPLFQLFTGNVQVFGLQSPDLFNTPGAMVMPFSALFLPLSIFILTTFYAQIPEGLEEAARVEGATRIGALFRVILPLSAPGVATAGVLTFIAVYNEFFFSFIMTDGQPGNWSPIVWGIIGYQTEYVELFNLMAAASLVGIIPVAILVVLAQEKIVSGLTAGAVKE